MKHVLKALATAAVAAPALLLCGGAAAQATYTWNLGGSSCNASGGSATCTTGTPAETASMTAWGNTGSGSTFVQGSIGNYDPSGMGATTGSNETGTNGHHAFDNKTTSCGSGSTNTGCGGSTELMLISFGPYKVRLTDVAVGWFSGDADVSILRWDGFGLPDPTSSVSGKTTSSLLTSGWTLVGSQDLAGSGTSTTDGSSDGKTGTSFTNPNDATKTAYKSNIGLGSQVSSYWIISTYFGNNSGTTSGKLGTGNDAFKLLSFSANICTGSVSGGSGGNGGTCGPSVSVAEPSMLATLGLALFGVAATRRRQVRRG
jgi:hypothetical protein